jgi:hypothetical protein
MNKVAVSAVIGHALFGRLAFSHTGNANEGTQKPPLKPKRNTAVSIGNTGSHTRISPPQPNPVKRTLRADQEWKCLSSVDRVQRVLMPIHTKPFNRSTATNLKGVLRHGASGFVSVFLLAGCGLELRY